MRSALIKKKTGKESIIKGKQRDKKWTWTRLDTKKKDVFHYYKITSQNEVSLRWVGGPK